MVVAVTYESVGLDRPIACSHGDTYNIGNAYRKADAEDAFQEALIMIVRLNPTFASDQLLIHKPPHEEDYLRATFKERQATGLAGAISRLQLIRCAHPTAVEMHRVDGDIR